MRIKETIKILMIVVFAFNNLNVYSQSTTAKDSLRFELLLDKQMVDSMQFDTPLLTSFQITSDHHLLLASENQFYLLGWGGIQTIGERISNSISSFEYTSDSTLMVIQNNQLSYIDSLGNSKKLYELPYRNMKIAAGDNVMYIYDQNEYVTKHPVYVLAKGGRYIELMETPSLISAITEKDKYLLFASENVLFLLNINTKDLVSLAVLPDKSQRIISIATDPLSNNIYFSTEKAIYMLKEKGFGCVTEDFSGVIKFSNNSLFVFNPAKKFLIRIVGIERFIEN